MIKPYFESKLICGDALNKLPELADNSVDSMVTDPQYGYSFMGKDWDKAVVKVEIWVECLRVLKPGAFAFIMAAPRQDVLSHMIVNLDKAGFKTDFTSIYWAYASGFPKAGNIGKMVDKKIGRLKYFDEFRKKLRKHIIENKITQQSIINHFNSEVVWHWFGNSQPQIPSKEKWKELKILIQITDKDFDKVYEQAEREVIGYNDSFVKKRCKKEPESIWNKGSHYGSLAFSQKQGELTEPGTIQAKELNGSYAGFQPKPAVEVIIVAMKPLSEKTYVDQAMKNGKGITWLDDCRIPTDENTSVTMNHTGKYSLDGEKGNFRYKEGIKTTGGNSQGRFPANILVSDDVLNDERERKSGKDVNPTTKGNDTAFFGGGSKYYNTESNYGDSGSFSRYFDLDKWAKKTFPFLIVPKACKEEKNRGLDNIKEKQVNDGRKDHASIDCPQQKGVTFRKNYHPTVKPIKLMSYLITLGSRQGDIILDPFCGSGTTCIAADILGRKYIGIEREKDYIEIAKARIEAEARQGKLAL